MVYVQSGRQTQNSLDYCSLLRVSAPPSVSAPSFDLEFLSEPPPVAEGVTLSHSPGPSPPSRGPLVRCISLESLPAISRWHRGPSLQELQSPSKLSFRYPSTKHFGGDRKSASSQPGVKPYTYAHTPACLLCAEGSVGRKGQRRSQESAGSTRTVRERCAA